MTAVIDRTYSSEFTVSDFFAGAGGSSTGAKAVPEVSLKVAANHWQLAVDTHNENHPEADHACVDLHLEDPRYFPRTVLGWFSPECTKWSQANGKELPAIEEGLFEDPNSDEAATRSRLLMFDVLRFAEHHRYQYLVIENVVDIAMLSKYRLAWHEWRAGLRRLGYKFRVVSLNSMHAQYAGDPAPQSRDRIYVVCWRESAPQPNLDAVLRPKAWCPQCCELVESQQAFKPNRTVGRYRSQYIYVHAACGTPVEPGYLPASSAIDWTLPGTRIGDRSKPLAEKTRARIAAGIARYWAPQILEAAGNTYDAANPRHPAHGRPDGYYRIKPVDDPLGTLHTTASKALVVPVEGREGKQAKPASDALRTMTCRAETAIAVPSDQLPFMLERRFEYRARSLDEPMSTLTANDTSKALVQPPFIAELRGGSSDARPASHPLATVTASGNHHGLVMPYYSGSKAAKSTDEPLGTVTTVDRHALIMRNNTARGDQGQMLTPALEPLRTLTTTGHQSLITPGDMEAARAAVDDCFFRMLEPIEIAAGMAFPADYLWRGTRRQRVRMAGNAVTPPAARDIITSIFRAWAQIDYVRAA